MCSHSQSPCCYTTRNASERSTPCAEEPSKRGRLREHGWYGLVVSIRLSNYVWLDNGDAYTAAQEHLESYEGRNVLKVNLPSEPQHKGRVERLFHSFNLSNIVPRDRRTAASLTLSELKEQFQKHIDAYQNKVQSQSEPSPVDRWHVNHTPVPLPVPHPEHSKEMRAYHVRKAGISVRGRWYWHPTLATFVGQQVTIGLQPHAFKPHAIEVFASNGQWICTAIATADTK